MILQSPLALCCYHLINAILRVDLAGGPTLNYLTLLTLVLQGIAFSVHVEQKENHQWRKFVW